MNFHPSRYHPTWVWDVWVRLAHWSLLVSVSAAWLTRHGFGSTHENLGYLALGIVLLRVIWGFVGSEYARFRQFLVAPKSAIAYVRSLFRGTQQRYLGHNPLGGWMSVCLWLLVFAVCASGWLYTTDAYWGVEWVERLHAVLTNILIAFVFLHVLGVIGTSLHEGENLILSMINGRKKARTDKHQS